MFSTWGFSQEEIAIHFDRPFYSNGDTVHFKIYLVGFDVAETFLDLQVGNSIDEGQRYNFFIPVKNNIGYGSFSIPYTTKTSIWNIQTHWYDSKNSRLSRIFETGIKVFNDTEETSTSSAVPKLKPINSSGILKINTDKPVYHPGEQVNINTIALDRSGSPIEANFSISVLHRPYLRSDHAPLSSVKVLQVKSVPKLNESLVWARRVINQDSGQSIDNDRIAVFLKDEGKIILADVDAGGVFHWQLSPFQGSKQIQYFDPKGRNIQVMPLQANEKNIQEEQEDASINLKNYFETNLKRKKIKFLFKQGEQPLSLPEDTILWSLEPDYTLLLKNYENVRSIEALTKLILTPLRIHRSKDGLIPKMVNPLNKPFFSGPPLFIIDRCLEADPNKALSLKIEHIISIDFYNLPHTIGHFGHLGRNGVVSISTKFPQLNQSGPSEKLNGIAAQNLRHNRTLVKNNNDLPAIHPLVYWNPDLMTDQNGQAKIVFNQSDDLGTFVIEVLAHGPEGFIHAMQKYQVEAR